MVLTDNASPNRRIRKLNSSKESPSRQLQHDLELAFEQLVMHDHERKKLYAYQRRSQQEELEARDLALAKSHMAALDAASARHEAVRQEAEAVLQRHLREQEEERKRKEAEERARQEKEAREKTERERKARELAEQKAREEKARREAEEQKARKAAEERARNEREESERREKEAKAQKEKDDRARLEKEKSDQEAVAKAQAEKAAAEAQAQQTKDQATVAASAKAAAAPFNSSKPGFYAASSEAETIHSEYLALHRKLKAFRKSFWEQAKTDKAFKSKAGEMRRDMNTSLGQLTDDKTGNRQAHERIKTNIMKALKDVPSPPVPVNDFLPAFLRLQNDNTQIPSLVIYLLSIFSKAVIAQFANEVAANPQAAESIGTLAAQVFSMAELSVPDPKGGRGSLIAILMCKFHATVPILFGVSGPETTTEGRIRLGWRAEDTGGPKKSFVTEKQQHDRLTGLGAGYASIALRNFSKARMQNPFPPSNYWQSLSYILNTPPQLISTSHLLLLKSMLDNNACDRFILFFGNAAFAILRTAMIDFPVRLSGDIQTSSAARSIGLLADKLARDKHVRFT